MPQHRATSREPKIRVAESFVGLGVFAARELARGSTVGRVRGKLIDEPDYGSAYCVDLGEGLTLEPHAPFRYLNHSCDPNCAFYVIEGDSGERHDRYLVVDALREIRPGEELLIDYGWPADSAIECHCKSDKCRGWVVDKAELAKLKRRLKLKKPGA